VKSGFHVYERAPTVDVTISLQPDAAPAASRLRLRNDSFDIVHECTNCWPATARVEAGIYSVEVVDTTPFANFLKSLPLDPPEKLYTVTLR
jgi:hypothetical protein